MTKSIPFLKPPLAEAQIVGAHNVMQSASLTAGEKTEEFESDFSDYIGTDHAIAVNSGTSALDLIFKSLLETGRLVKGDTVVVPSFTFVACANTIINNGLKPYFLDIEDHTLNMNTNLLRFSIPQETRAVLCVHTFGRPLDMEMVQLAANDKDFIIIEDCAEACGATFKRERVGSIGMVGAFSFISTKNMTTGEGGMVTTSIWELALTARALRSHGMMNRKAISGTTVNYKDVYKPGMNYRMTEFQADLGIHQLSQLETNNDFRRKHSEKLTEILKECDSRLHLLPSKSNEGSYVHSIFTFLLPKDYPQSSRDEVLRRLYSRGIEAKIYFDTPIHKFSYYRKMFPKLELPVTESVCSRAIALPMYPTLTDEEVEYMGQSVNQIFKEGHGS